MTTAPPSASSSDQTRSAVFRAAGEPLEITSVPTPAPRPGEVLVRVTCCTLCGSDLHTYQGHRCTPVPTILGHEIIGRIEAIGAATFAGGEEGSVEDLEGEPLRVGDRITWSVAASCGHCFFCTHDLPQKCESLFKYGHERLTPDHPLSGGLAERCLLAPGTAIVRLPDHLPDAVACPINCATSTVAAALRTGKLSAGETVVVQGAGALGLTAAAMARSMGATNVIVCDLSDDRLALSKEFGATHTVNVATDGGRLAEVVRAATAGRGADLAVELSGAASAVEAGPHLLRIGGRHVLVGSVSKSRDAALNPELIVRRMLTVQGVHNYTPADLLAAVRFIAEHHSRYPFERLVGSTWPLSAAEDAFRAAISRGDLRVAVTPGAGQSA